MDRRRFLRNAALVATGAVAADQLELLDRLGWVRRFFAGFGAGARYEDEGKYLTANGQGMYVTQAQWEALLREDYVRESIVGAMNDVSPFRAAMIRRKPLIEVVRS